MYNITEGFRIPKRKIGSQDKSYKVKKNFKMFDKVFSKELLLKSF